MSARFNEWLDRGEPAADGFVRSAIGEIPRITVSPAKLNPKAWGFNSVEEMEAACDTPTRPTSTPSPGAAGPPTVADDVAATNGGTE